MEQSEDEAPRNRPVPSAYRQGGKSSRSAPKAGKREGDDVSTPTQRRRDLRALGPGSAANPLETEAVRASTSTDQTIVSPGSSPSTVATDCGTVVFNEPEPATARKALDSNFVGISPSSSRNKAKGHKVGPQVGSFLGQKYIYSRSNRSKHRPMSVPWDDGIAVRDRRALAQMAQDPDSVEPIGPVRFKVRSSSGSGFYTTELKAGVWICDCPDWKDRQLPCTHVLRILHALDPSRTPVEGAALDAGRKRYGQDWPAYDRAHQSEPLLFDSLVWDLLEPLQGLDVPRPVGKPGRPSTPLRIQFLVAAKYVRSKRGSRGANGELAKDCKAPDSILAKPLNITAPSRLFNRPETTHRLLDLIERSSLPLAEIEDGGTVAIDSTGFCIECRGAYCTEKHNPNRRHTWIKAHLIVGTKTHIILSAKITDEHGADCPQFMELLNRVVGRGHRPSRVAADKAYLKRDNIDGALELGIDPKIPFKVNSIARAKGSPGWRQKYFEFMSKRPEFDREYHLRSNVESVNSAIKRTLGEQLLSHNSIARFNELLMRLLCYNISVIIEQAFEHGIYPSLKGVGSTRTPPQSGEQDPNLCESTDGGGKESTESERLL
jgi:hypothetical protein